MYKPGNACGLSLAERHDAHLCRVQDEIILDEPKWYKVCIFRMVQNGTNFSVSRDEHVDLIRQKQKHGVRGEISAGVATGISFPQSVCFPIRSQR